MVTPYKGAYPEFFTHIIRVRALRTAIGWLEIAVKLPTVQTQP